MGQHLRLYEDVAPKRSVTSTDLHPSFRHRLYPVAGLQYRPEELPALLRQLARRVADGRAWPYRRIGLFPGGERGDALYDSHQYITYRM